MMMLLNLIEYCKTRHHLFINKNELCEFRTTWPKTYEMDINILAEIPECSQEIQDLISKMEKISINECDQLESLYDTERTIQKLIEKIRYDKLTIEEVDCEIAFLDSEY